MLKGRFLRGAALMLALLLLVFTLLYMFDLFGRAENVLYDALYQSVSPVDARIVIIGIDDDSISRIGQWPWPRSVMAEVVDKLGAGGAAAVGIDILYDTRSSSPGEDAHLADAIDRAGNVALPVLGLFHQKSYAASGGYTSVDELAEPIEDFRGARPAHVNVMPESDGVVRRALLNLSYGGHTYQSLSFVLYDMYRERLGFESIQSEIPIDPAGRYYVSFTDHAGRYRPVSFADVYEGNVPPLYFEGKIVLIGLYAQGVARDWYYTAIDGQFPTYGVEIHANMVQQLLEGSFLRDLSPAMDFALFAFFSVAASALFVLLKPRMGLLLLAAMLAVYCGVIYGMARSGIVARMTYVPSFCLLAYFATLIWHYAQTRANEARVRGTFGRYMAPSIIKKILDDGEETLKLGGQRRTVSVLFVDIRGFTPLSEATEPEEMVQILNEYLNLVASCIHRYGGTLDKFIGDAAMAIWGAPYDIENHTLSAVRAAMDMRRDAAVLEQKLLEKHGRSVRFGIGINTGDAIIGNIGCDFRMDYTAIGDTVNTAARLESNAKPGQILISRAAADNLGGSGIQLLPLGGLKVKGKAEEIEVFDVTEDALGEAPS